MFKKLSAILLAVLVLFTNVSFTLTTHYCGGKAMKKSMSFSPHDLSCGMTDMDKTPCSKNNQTQSLEKKKCCENKYTTISIEDEFTQQEVIVSSTINFNFLSAFLITYVNNYFFEKKESNSSIASSPPLIEQDKSVLFQVFRI